MGRDDQPQPDSPKILVAEDEPLIRMDIVETLAIDGFQVLEASDGSEALRLIDDPDNFAMVVTDVNMPGVDGIDVAVRARERHPEIPVLFVSARTDLLSLPRTPRPLSHLTKPFNMPDLARKVRWLLLGRDGD